MGGGSGSGKWEWEGQTLSKGFVLILSKQLYNNDEIVTGTERTVWDRSRIREGTALS